MLLRLVKKKKISLKEHYNRRNKVLIKRKCGGYGDILMTRMIFEDFSKSFPEIEFYFTCPPPYIQFAENHPYVKTVPIGAIEEKNYGITYDISTACRTHEMKMMQNNRDNRSDIWAKFCGVKLTNHEPHFKCNEELKQKCKEAFKELNPTNKPIVLFVPTSSSPDIGISKSLNQRQICEITEKLKHLGYFIFTIHNEKSELFEQLGIQQFTGISTELWASLVAISDYVISVDTATFHLAGCLKRPLVGIFSFTDGKLYGKYYNFKLVQKHKDDGNWECGPCYYLITCPKSKEFPKPCLTELTSDEILNGFFQLHTKPNQAEL
jgi:ADP-heptose:LPS heptosyltransferase